MPQLELEAARTAVVLPIPLPGAFLAVVAPLQSAIYRCGCVRPCTTLTPSAIKMRQVCVAHINILSTGSRRHEHAEPILAIVAHVATTA
jgi:hypothetical protein